MFYMKKYYTILQYMMVVAFCYVSGRITSQTLWLGRKWRRTIEILFIRYLISTIYVYKNLQLIKAWQLASVGQSARALHQNCRPTGLIPARGGGGGLNGPGPIQPLGTALHVCYENEEWRFFQVLLVLQWGCKISPLHTEKIILIS